jgi:predicted permease
VLSHGLWRDRYGSDPSIIGRTIEVDGTTRTVVGVMRTGFAFPGPEARLWVPIVIDASIQGDYWGSYGPDIVGRLREGVTREQATAELRSIAARLREENPVWTPDETPYLADVEVVPLRESMVGDSRLLLLVLLGAAGLVLLTACVNVANLLLVRGAAREQEMALRSALGAGRNRLLRQLASETLVLALIGGLAGVLLAVSGLRVLVSLLPPETPRLHDVAVDARVLAFGLVLSLATGLLFGLAPAARLAGTGGRAALASGARTVGSNKRRLASVLVCAEIAVAIVLVVGATLLLRSLARLQQVDPGFRAEQLLSARVSLPEARYASGDARTQFWSQLLEQVRAAPNVKSASATTQLPFDGNNFSIAMWLDGYTTDRNRLDVMDWRRVSPGFPEAMGMRVVQGRDFDERDRAGSAPVAYVDERAAELFWKGRDPVGGRVRYPWGGDWLTVVGVVSSVKNETLSQEAQPTLYTPIAQSPQASAMLVIRTSNPGQAAQDLRTIVSRLAADAPVSDVRTLEQRLSASIVGQRSAAALIGTFAFVALLLGVIGTYGVMAWVTGRRSREIAVRMAVGARAHDVIGMVVRQGALAFAGAAGGVVLAFALTRLLRDLLFGVSPTDPLTFAAVPIVLVAVALIASWIPARRSSRVQVVAALREYR